MTSRHRADVPFRNSTIERFGGRDWRDNERTPSKGEAGPRTVQGPGREAIKRYSRPDHRLWFAARKVAQETGVGSAEAQPTFADLSRTVPLHTERDEHLLSY